MMDKIGIYEYKTEVYSLDFRGRLTIPTLGNYLLHAATCHAAEHGWGYADMTQRNTAWVLSRLAVEIKDRERLSEPIKIYTWVEKVERIFTYRCFEVTTLQDETLAYARSVWAAIDMDTRRPTSLESMNLNDFIVERPCPVADFCKIRSAEDSPETQFAPYKVKYSDLDINGHFNSIKYMEAMLDLFDIETFRTRSISRFEIIYQAEGRYGMELMLYKKQLEENKYVSSICKDGKPFCRMQTIFR